MLLVVAESSGSSPGRLGYKMAVAAEDELIGSIGGGVMEVRLVEQSRAILSEPVAIATGFPNGKIVDQVHRKDVPNASGMICSGRQTVIFKQLNSNDLRTVEVIIDALEHFRRDLLLITSTDLKVAVSGDSDKIPDFHFKIASDNEFEFEERLGPKNELYIIGGGHCSLALSQLMSNMDFHISIFDDRPELNTIEKNKFADAIEIIDGYEQIGELVHAGPNVYVVVMTLGYRSDEVVIRKILDKDFKYFGVLGSCAKMKTLLTALEKDGFAKAKLERIRTPIGLPINSHSPDEIAVSIAAEIISVKNAN